MDCALVVTDAEEGEVSVGGRVGLVVGELVGEDAADGFAGGGAAEAADGDAGVGVRVLLLGFDEAEGG